MIIICKNERPLVHRIIQLDAYGSRDQSVALSFYHEFSFGAMATRKSVNHWMLYSSSRPMVQEVQNTQSLVHYCVSTL